MTLGARWSGRTGHSSVVLLDGSIIFMGGSNKNDVWRSTDKGATWDEVTTSAEWSGRSDHSSVVLPDGSIVLMGGTAGPKRTTSGGRQMAGKPGPRRPEGGGRGALGTPALCYPMVASSSWEGTATTAIT